MKTEESTTYSVRLNSETKSKIQELLSEYDNANTAYEHVINVLELSKSKQAAPGQSTNINNFEIYSQKMISLYVNAIENQITAENLANEKFANEIETLKSNNHDLTNTIAKLEHEKTELENKILSVETENKNIKLKIQEKTDYFMFLKKVEELLEYNKSINIKKEDQNSAKKQCK